MMIINERVNEALKANETLTDSERYELTNLLQGMAFDIRFEMGPENAQEHAVRITAVIGFLQQTDRISEDEEEELHMIVNEIEAEAYK
jgi:hypothetical protein